MKSQNGSMYSDSKFDQQSNRSHGSGELRWPAWLAGLGIFMIILYMLCA